MSLTQRQERIKAQRINTILAAARKIFGEKGFDAATMDDIAQEADCTKRTLYLHVQSKTDLLLGLMEQSLHLILGQYRDAMATATSGAEALSRIGGAGLQLFKTSPDHFSLFSVGPNLFPQLTGNPRFKQIQMLNASLHDLIRSCFARGISDGSIRSGIDPDLTALFLMFATSGLFNQMTQQGAFFQTLYGQSPERFILHCMEMLGASFLPNRENLGKGTFPG